TGALETKPDDATNRLSLAALPDRWLVLRLFVPTGAQQASFRGWVICADIGSVVGLAAWQGEQALPAAKRDTVSPDELTGSVGGSAQWASVYDAVGDRFAFHDPLDDLATVAPNGVTVDQAGYLIAGWWSKAELDPLDAARTDASLHDHLSRMGWQLVEDQEDGHQLVPFAAVEAAKRSSLDLVSAERYGSPEPPATNPGPAPGPIARAIEPMTRYEPAITPFADVAGSVVSSEPL